MAVYRVVVVNQAGYQFGDIEPATIGEVVWALNEQGGVPVTASTAATNGALARPGREIQVWRDAQILWWGPIVRPSFNLSSTKSKREWECAGIPWYLSRRHFGRADRQNLLSNGDFESGIDGWALTGPATAVADATKAVSGTGSAKLTCSTPAGEAWIGQTYTHVTQYHPQGDLVTVTGWVYIPSVDWVAPAPGDAGLYVAHSNAGGLVAEPNAPVNADTPRDVWTRLTTENVILNVKAGDTLETRLYAPEGVIHWDLITTTLMESLSFDDEDVATIVEQIVLYAQDRHPAFHHQKSDLRIGTACPASGIRRTRSFQFAEHRNIGDAIDEITRAGDLDVSVEITATTRTFTTWSPRKGTHQAGYTLVLDTTVAEATWSWDGEKAATNVVALGAGDGPDREEGGASDAAFLDGLTLEQVVTAPDGTGVGELDARAAADLAVYHRPEILEVTLMPAVGIGVLTTGDTVDSTLADGTVDLGGRWRIMRLALRPATDQLHLTLNPEITVEEAMARFPNAVDACQAPGGGVWVVGSDGGVGAYGVATYHGSMGGEPLAAPMVAIVAHGAGGYWLAGADGGIFAFGDAPVRYPYTPMIDTEYPAGDRAITAAEPVDPSGDDTLILIADDGATYTGLLAPYTP